MQTTQIWMIAIAAAALLLAGLAVAWWHGRRPAQPPLPVEWALSGRPVFSSDERKVYRHLREALPNHVVLAKLPLLRLAQADDPQRVQYWFELLGGIHVTFAVCSASGRVLLAFDLDTRLANGAVRAQQIKEQVLAACKVRYLRIPVDALPSARELQLLLPPSSSAARAAPPAAAGAPALGQEGASVGSRRRDSRTLWQESGYFQDSFFGGEPRGDGSSDFGALGGIVRGGAGARTSRPGPAADAGAGDAGPGDAGTAEPPPR